MKKISDEFFYKYIFYLYNYFGMQCQNKAKTSDYYAVQKSPEYMEGLFFRVLYCLADHVGGGGGGVVVLSF